jgi:hypothetical protein
MQNRSSKAKRPKKPTDIVEMARSIVDQATGEAPKVEPPAKNPHAVELGRLGGKKGGKARASKLTAEQRAEIAKKAATARWGKKSG